MSRLHRRMIAAACMVAALALLPAAPALAANASLPRIEEQVMCVTCRIPLDTAKSPQATVEREYIRGLIGRGLNEPAIKKELVAQYGPAVLSLPSTKGFDLAAYLVPIAVVAALLALLTYLLPRWLRRTRGGEPASADGAHALSAEDARRLEEDMARFD